MYDVKSHSQLADATAEMVRACTLATVRSASMAASLGITLWAQMLMPGSPWSAQSRLPWEALQSWAAWSPDRFASPKPQPEISAAAATQSADPTYASYRSSGGHAAAQVVVG